MAQPFLSNTSPTDTEYGIDVDDNYYSYGYGYGEDVVNGSSIWVSRRKEMEIQNWRWSVLSAGVDHDDDDEDTDTVADDDDVIDIAANTLRRRVTPVVMDTVPTATQPRLVTRRRKRWSNSIGSRTSTVLGSVRSSIVSSFRSSGERELERDGGDGVPQKVKGRRRMTRVLRGVAMSFGGLGRGRIVG
ncbi:MAG: hypothetical protein Q9220_006429 [cf. Caloplaca sp. 1 TL-2023]